MFSADSPGRSTSSAKPLLIFDLDGTVLSVNSFPYWVRAMLRRRPLKAAQILAQRKLLGAKHAITKHRFQQLWRLINDDAALHDLCEMLCTYVRPNLKPLLETGGKDDILATSAAEEYAQEVGLMLGFQHILATQINGAENCKEEKRSRVMGFINASGWQNRPRIFFTDHEEDLPLIKECTRTLWFGPSGKIAYIRAQAPGAEIVDCNSLSAEDIVKLSR